MLILIKNAKVSDRDTQCTSSQTNTASELHIHSDRMLRDGDCGAPEWDIGKHKAARNSIRYLFLGGALFVDGG